MHLHVHINAEIIPRKISVIVFTHISAKGDLVFLSCIFFSLVEIFNGSQVHWRVCLAEEHLYEALLIKRVMLIACYWILVIIVSIVIIRFLQPMVETDCLHHLLSHLPVLWGLHCHLGTQIMDQIPLIQSTALKPQCQASVKSSIIMRPPKPLQYQSIK